MNDPNEILSRREFLKLSSLAMLGLALRPNTNLRRAVDLVCPPPPFAQGLSAEQRARLLAASRTFIAPDATSARQVALNIDFVEGSNEAASTMCGPLSIAILQASELVGPWARRHDFWLLNPRQNLHPVENTFPKGNYDWYVFDTPISKFDFSAFPLQSGDLVYLHAAPGDSFEHVLVVNNVDEKQRAYAVTNFFTPEGTIIEERMLVDPADPSTGQFAAWADRTIRKTHGNTGNGGFRLWRVKDGRTLEFPTDEASRKLRAGLDEIFLAAAGTWFTSIKKAGGAQLYEFNPYEPFHPASTIKVPIALAFYHWLEREHPADWQTYIEVSGTSGRTFSQLLSAMIVQSEEDATEVLADFLGKGYLQKIWSLWGLKDTQIDPRRSSATEISTVFEKLYLRSWISPDHREHLLKLLSTYTVNDNTRLGTLRSSLPEGSTIYNKRGSLVDWPRVVGDSGIVELGLASAKNAYIVTFHGVGKDAAGYDDLELVLDKAIAVLGQYFAKVSKS